MGEGGEIFEFEFVQPFSSIFYANNCKSPHGVSMENGQLRLSRKKMIENGYNLGCPPSQ